jgi:hypothetical protein
MGSRTIQTCQNKPATGANTANQERTKLMGLPSDSDLKEQILYNLEEYSEDGQVPHYDSDFII